MTGWSQARSVAWTVVKGGVMAILLVGGINVALSHYATMHGARQCKALGGSSTVVLGPFDVALRGWCSFRNGGTIYFP